MKISFKLPWYRLCWDVQLVWATLSLFSCPKTNFTVIGVHRLSQYLQCLCSAWPVTVSTTSLLHTNAHIHVHTLRRAVPKHAVNHWHTSVSHWPAGKERLKHMLQWRRWTHKCVYVCFLTVSESWGLRSTLRKRNAKTGTMQIAVASAIVNHTTGCNNVLCALPVCTNTHCEHKHE